jgi:hypothetical protein
MVGIGGYHLGTPELEAQESTRIVRMALDEGINSLDSCWDDNNGERPCRQVRLEPDLLFVIGGNQFWIRQGFKAQSVQRIRRIGDQLPQKNLLLRVEGVNHQIQKLCGFSLKLKRLDPGGGCHDGFSWGVLQ